MKKSVSIFILLCFFFTSIVGSDPVYAQSIALPAPGVMVHLSPQCTPALLKGIVIDPKNAFKFDFIIYRGKKPFTDAQKNQEYAKLIKYFLASLAVPDEDQWVNLSPYEKNRIIKEDFGKTAMGRDLLAQDYLLKQITASLIYPQGKLGQQFWDSVYARAYKQFGTTNIPVNTFNKVWIVPDEADIYERGNAAYLYKSHLKVMLEEDYLSLSYHQQNKSHSIASQVVRQIILPQLEKEVNEGENFAPLRQVFSGMILAAWYKRALRQSLLARLYANKDKVKGIDQDPANNEIIYQQYLKAYKKGVFNFIKEDVDQYTHERVPRKYFSGGTALVEPGTPLDIHDQPVLKFMKINRPNAAIATLDDLGGRGGNNTDLDEAQVSLGPNQNLNLEKMDNRATLRENADLFSAVSLILSILGYVTSAAYPQHIAYSNVSMAVASICYLLALKNLIKSDLKKTEIPIEHDRFMVSEDGRYKVTLAPANEETEALERKLSESQRADIREWLSRQGAIEVIDYPDGIRSFHLDAPVAKVKNSTDAAMAISDVVVLELMHILILWIILFKKRAPVSKNTSYQDHDGDRGIKTNRKKITEDTKGPNLSGYKMGVGAKGVVLTRVYQKKYKREKISFPSLRWQRTKKILKWKIRDEDLQLIKDKVKLIDLSLTHRWGKGILVYFERPPNVNIEVFDGMVRVLQRKLRGKDHVHTDDFFSTKVYNKTKKVIRKMIDDMAMTSDQAQNSDLGGIDMNAAHLKMNIKRDDLMGSLPVSQQDWAQVHIEGLVPEILEIRPASVSLVLSQLAIS